MSSQKMAPSPGRQLLIVALIFALMAVLVFLTTGCAAYDALVGMFTSAQEATDEAGKTAVAVRSVMEDIHHFLTHYLPAMATGYGIGRVGEVGIKKLKPISRCKSMFKKNKKDA